MEFLDWLRTTNAVTEDVLVKRWKIFDTGDIEQKIR